MAASNFEPEHIDGDFLEFCQNTLTSLSYVDDNRKLSDDELRSLLLTTGTERSEFLKWILQQWIGQELIKCETHDDLKTAYVQECFVADQEAEQFVSGSADEASQLPVWRRIFRSLDAISKLKDPNCRESLFVEQLKKWSSKSSPYAKFKSQMRKIKLEQEKVEEQKDMLYNKKEICGPKEQQQQDAEESQDQILEEISSLEEQFVDIFEKLIIEPCVNADEESNQIPEIVNASLLIEINSCLKQFKTCMKTKSAIIHELEKWKRKCADSSNQDISKSLDFSPLQHILDSLRED